MLKKRQKSGGGGGGALSKQTMMMNSSASSLVTSSGHPTPSSPILSRPRPSVGGSSAGKRSPPASMPPAAHRPKQTPHGPRKRPQAHRALGGSTVQLHPQKHGTARKNGTSRAVKPVKPGKPVSTAPLADQKKPPAEAAATVAGPPQSDPSSSSRSSSTKVTSTMKPPKTRRRRRRRGDGSKAVKGTAHASSVTTHGQTITDVATATPAPADARVVGIAAELSPEWHSPLVSPITRGATSHAVLDGSVSPPWREMVRFQAHPVTTLISSRYEDAVRTPHMPRASKSDNSPSSAAAGSALATTSLTGSAPRHSVGSPGFIDHRFPSRPDFTLEVSGVFCTAPRAAAALDTLSSSDFPSPQLQQQSSSFSEPKGPSSAAAPAVVVNAAGAAAEHLIPATAGIPFVAASPCVESSSDVVSSSPAMPIQLASFSALQSPLTGTKNHGGEPLLLSAEDRQLSAVGLRIGAPAFQPHPSPYTSADGFALLGSPNAATASASFSARPSSSSPSPGKTGPARNVIKVVNTATGAMQRHTPASDFPRTPATTAPSVLVATGASESPELDPSRSHSQTLYHHNDPSLSTSSSRTVGDTSLASPHEFPSLPRPPLSRSGSHHVSPLVAPAPARDVRHQHITIARFVSEENEIISQLFDVPDEEETNQADAYSPGGLLDDDEEEDLVQRDWEVASVASSAGRGARRSLGAAYWHLDHGNAVYDEEAMDDALAHHAAASSSYSNAAGFWPHEDYDASIADPDEYEDIWEVNSSAYEDSLDEAQVQWIEDQVRANENPEGFFL